MQDSDAQVRLQRLAELPLRPVGPQRGLVGGTLASLRDIAGYRELLGLLVRRELKARYKNSSLGFVWSLLKPAGPAAHLLHRHRAVPRRGAGIPDFAIFVFTGLTMWALFSEIISGGTASILATPA